jgi:predicted pyridoxine 5'-phosphate oxidase superfamily flavin-nucleotide-binding protein
LSPSDEPFHEGERLVQQRTGELDTADRHGAMIKASLAPAWARFLEPLPMLVLGSRDEAGAVWASVLFGQPGLVRVDGPSRVVLDLSRARPAPGDPWLDNLRQGGPLAVLAIDLAQRRRLRLNGLVGELGPDRVVLELSETYPNCSQYITPHTPVPAGSGQLLEGHTLEEAQEAAIGRAHTLFVASHHPVRGLDVSHRGGPSPTTRATRCTTRWATPRSTRTWAGCCSTGAARCS